MRHYIEPYFLDPQHRIGVLVVGCGGTGSRVLNGLAEMDHSLRQLGHPGLFVVAADDDIVSEANLGRQAFSTVDVGRFKCSVLVERINRAFGVDWVDLPGRITGHDSLAQAVKVYGPLNMLVSCVDSGAARVEIGKALKQFDSLGVWRSFSYWLDFGNSKDSGQIVLGTCRTIKQPDGAEDVAPCLPSVLDFFPTIAERDDLDDTPSCSLADALKKQDLFVNRIMADFGLNIVWRMFRQGYTEVQGAFVGLESLVSSPLRVDEAVWNRYGIDMAATTESL
ncbi:MAG: PRTRC system ThiF family protein [Proteobacteria bacterium]|nr:PRTRC system ThiF family protein [Pseudomonadota bacterium]